MGRRYTCPAWHWFVMRPTDPRPQDRVPVSSGRLPLIWTWLSASAGVLAFAGSVFSLLQQTQVYGRETDLLFNAAIAQDVVNGLVVAPLLVILAFLARRGSMGSWLSLAGCLGFTAYNYSIYTFSIQFGPLFLDWTAVLASPYSPWPARWPASCQKRVTWSAGRPPGLTGWASRLPPVPCFTLLWL